MTLLYYVVAALLGAGIGKLMHAAIWGVVWLFGASFAVSVWWFVVVGVVIGAMVAWGLVEITKWLLEEVILR